jgi:hypothetical protein
MQMILTDDTVPEPVGGSRDGDTLGANGKLENLSDDDPACRTPCTGTMSANATRKSFRNPNLRCKEEDEQAHKDDQDVARRLRVLGYGADNGDHKLADRHADSSPNE